MAEKAKKRVTTVDVIKGLIRWEDGVAYCAIDTASGCHYSQAKFDSANFGRHFRSQHREAAQRNNFPVTPEKKVKTIPKIPVAINQPVFIEGCIKMVTMHHLPLSCFEWEGMKLLLDPIANALNCVVNRKNIKLHLEVTANKIKQAIIMEIHGKLISVKLDSASRHHRHILGINIQYEKENQVVIRTLGKLLTVQCLCLKVNCN